MRFLRSDFFIVQSLSYTSRSFNTQYNSVCRNNTVSIVCIQKAIPQVCFKHTPVKIGRVNFQTSKTDLIQRWGGQRYFSSKADTDRVHPSEDETEKKTRNEDNDVTGYNYSSICVEDEGSVLLSEENIQELTKGDEELIRKVKFIQMEHELGRQEGLKMPAQISMRHWAELLEIQSRARRRKFFGYLWKTEMKRLGEKRKKIEAQEQRARELGNLPPRPTLEEDIFGMVYGLTRNTYHMRLYETTINSFFHHRVISAMVLGQPLVIDCGYDAYMTPREAKNCAAQVEYLLSENRHHLDPMDVHLCNARKDSKLISFLLRRIPVLFEPEYAINITEKSYLDLFPKRELVYLSPHAREDLIEYSEDEIYIIGAMVDKTDPRPYSLAKAKKEGLKMKKLPLDRYLEFGSGSGKSLTINQMGSIMMDVRQTKDWNSAFQFVPRRKLRQKDEEDEYPSSRRERPSDVLTDFELMSKRKGFKSFSAHSVPSKSPNLRTIMSDN